MKQEMTSAYRQYLLKKAGFTQKQIASELDPPVSEMFVSREMLEH